MLNYEKSNFEIDELYELWLVGLGIVLVWLSDLN
jgi:hypothetical protein